jgi:hypothetical protein
MQKLQWNLPSAVTIQVSLTRLKNTKITFQKYAVFIYTITTIHKLKFKKYHLQKDQ